MYLSFGNEGDQLFKLTSTSTVNAKYALIPHRQIVQVQRNVNFGIPAHHNDSALQTTGSRL